MSYVSARGRRAAPCLVGSIVAVALGAASLLPSAAEGEIYRWVDSDGRLHVTQHLDEVPPQSRPGAIPGPSDPGRGSVQTFDNPTAPPAAQAPGPVPSPVQRTYRVAVQRAG